MGSMQIFIGLCFVAMASATGTPWDCYQCERGSSDQLCNLDGSQPCEDGNDACYIYYHRHLAIVEITKKCINASDCIRPGDYLCNYDYSRCSFCCTANPGCNYHTPTKPTTDAPLKGDRGPRGPPGAEGEPGWPGPKGPYGPPGPPGWNGVEGEKGNKGVKGQVGKRGHPGDAGPYGPKGNRGEDGPPGPTGPTGAVGGVGEKGDDGPDGHPGNQGDRGNAGLQGPKGATGPKGFRGHAGPGIKGSKGEKGDDGDKGVKGDGGKGSKGECGVPGDVGPPGWPGDDGPDVECECEPEPIVYFTVLTGHDADYRVTVPTLVVAYQVQVTNMNTLGVDGLDSVGLLMHFTAPADGVYFFTVSAVSICTLAFNIAIVNGDDPDTSTLVYTGRDINDAINEFPVGTAYVAYCMYAGDVITVAALPQVPPLPTYYYPTPHPTDVYFSGCLLGLLTGGAVCPTSQYAGGAPPELFPVVSG